VSEVLLQTVGKKYNAFVAVDSVDLRVGNGEFLTLLGPSGCGKTTTLRMIAGFVIPTTGSISIGGRDVTMLPANQRDVGMVFQSYALFPHMTVAQNVGFGLRMRGVTGTDASGRVRDALQLVQLAEFAERYPRELSGGQQQRVALARAVVIRPSVLLMDEPLGALDLKLRQELQAEIKKIQKEVGITTVYVTHDQGEALSMSDRIAVMREGRIVQLDVPERLYSAPTSKYVANFIGRTNLLLVEIDAALGNARSKDGEKRTYAFRTPETGLRGGEALLGFRPENVEIGTSRTNRIEARVLETRYYGSARSVILVTQSGSRLEVDLHAASACPQLGETVPLSWSPDQSFVLPVEP
jgi:spermidine/putrescine ABC transporter ATP-binding subunit